MSPREYYCFQAKFCVQIGLTVKNNSSFVDSDHFSELTFFSEMKSKLIWIFIMLLLSIFVSESLETFKERVVTYLLLKKSKVSWQLHDLVICF